MTVNFVVYKQMQIIEWPRAEGGGASCLHSSPGASGLGCEREKVRYACLIYASLLQRFILLELILHAAEIREA